MNLIFGIEVDLDLSQAGIEGQGRRSKVKVTCQKSCFGINVALLIGQRSGSRSKVEIKVIGHGQRSRSNFWSMAVDISGSALPSAAKSNKSHYQSHWGRAESTYPQGSTSCSRRLSVTSY